MIGRCVVYDVGPGFLAVASFRKVIANVRRGKIAKIEGTTSELEQAHNKLSSMINGERIVIKRRRRCLYIAVSIPESVSVALFPRQ